MSLADDLIATLPVLRAQAESLMVDECIVRRGTGETVVDPDTGSVVDAPGVTVYEGKCKVQSKDSATATPDAGGHTFVSVSRQIHIPANSADVEDDDVVEITASRFNTLGVGKMYRVEGFTPDSFDTAARLPVKEMTS